MGRAGWDARVCPIITEHYARSLWRDIGHKVIIDCGLVDRWLVLRMVRNTHQHFEQLLQLMQDEEREVFSAQLASSSRTLCVVIWLPLILYPWVTAIFARGAWPAKYHGLGWGGEPPGV